MERIFSKATILYYWTTYQPIQLKLHFYDKESEHSQGLGLNLNDGRFVMDVNLKREYQIGWLAKCKSRRRNA